MRLFPSEKSCACIEACSRVSEGIVTELRRECKVIISLAATKQCFSLEVDLDEIEILRKPVVREAVAESKNPATLRS